MGLTNPQLANKISISRRGDVPNGEIPKAKPLFILSFFESSIYGTPFSFAPDIISSSIDILD